VWEGGRGGKQTTPEREAPGPQAFFVQDLGKEEGARGESQKNQFNLKNMFGLCDKNKPAQHREGPSRKGKTEVPATPNPWKGAGPRGGR